jgi:hypothetical protein
MLRSATPAFDSKLSPTTFVARHTRGGIPSQRPTEGGRTGLEKLLALTGKATATNSRLAFEQGAYPAVLRWQISDLTRQSSKRYVSPGDLAVLYAQLGRCEETLSPRRSHPAALTARALDPERSGVRFPPLRRALPLPHPTDRPPPGRTEEPAPTPTPQSSSTAHPAPEPRSPSRHTPGR